MSTGVRLPNRTPGHIIALRSSRAAGTDSRLRFPPLYSLPQARRLVPYARIGDARPVDPVHARHAGLLALAGIVATSAQATSGGGGSGKGTIKALKGGDRKVGEASNRTYALPVAGALFEYTTSASKAADPSSTGWTAFPSATDATGVATVQVDPGTYYVRERSVPSGFASYGPVKSLYFDPSSDVPSSARPYVARVKVESGKVTEAYPNRDRSGDPDDWDTTYPGDSGSPFVNVRDNASFPSVCGINILLVLDRSGSIGPYRTTYRDAAKAFVDSLDGTPTQIGILSFSVDGQLVPGRLGHRRASRTSPLDLSQGGQRRGAQRDDRRRLRQPRAAARTGTARCRRRPRRRASRPTRRPARRPTPTSSSSSPTATRPRAAPTAPTPAPTST